MDIQGIILERDLIKLSRRELVTCRLTEESLSYFTRNDFKVKRPS